MHGCLLFVLLVHPLAQRGVRSLERSATGASPRNRPGPRRAPQPPAGIPAAAGPAAAALCEPDQARPARQEWEAAVQRGAVSQLAAPARGGAPGLRNPKAGKSFAQLAALDDMVDL